MNIQIISTLTAAAFMQEHNLRKDILNKHITNKAISLMDKYTPMENGVLKRPQVTSEGAYYEVPYAHYQYIGEVYGPNILFSDGSFRSPKKKKKHPTGKKISYHDASMRGDHWDERMMADRAEELEQDAVTFIAGGG